MSDDKTPAEKPAEISEQQLEEVAGGTGCILIPVNPDDPTEDPWGPNKPINPFIIY